MLNFYAPVYLAPYYTNTPSTAEEESYKSVEASQEDAQEDSWTLLGRDATQLSRPAQPSSVRLSLSQSPHCKRLTRMKLSVVLLFLSALTFGSGERCTGGSKNNDYDKFSTKHYIKETFDFASKPAWKTYLENNQFNSKKLCGRAPKQTFFNIASEPEVKKICDGEGYEEKQNKAGKPDNLCISMNEFTVHVVDSTMENGKCEILDVKTDKMFVVVGCEKVDNKCLPVHFETQTNGKGHGDVCKPKMKLSVLLMFLLALTPSSGKRCDRDYNNQNGYEDFSDKHILPKDFPINPLRKDLNYIFEKYLQKHDLCGRVGLQTFFDCSNTDRYARPNVLTVENICNGKGFEYGNKGNLCISEQKFPVYMV
ncbi:hypothetical protein NFI96_006362, partial [Prochilodus magdalenae]